MQTETRCKKVNLQHIQTWRRKTDMEMEYRVGDGIRDAEEEREAKIYTDWTRYGG